MADTSPQTSDPQITALFGRSKKGIDFDALDGESVYLIFMLVAPISASGVHLKILAKVSISGLISAIEQQ